MIDGRQIDLGPCCGCGRTGAVVRNVVMLTPEAPIAGHGWGCIQCGLPADGAIAVLCDDCCQRQQAGEENLIRCACRGYPATDGRVPIDQLTGLHAHDMSKHPETQQRCRQCGCTESTACVDLERGACHWVEPDLCSHCVLGVMPHG